MTMAARRPGTATGRRVGTNPPHGDAGHFRADIEGLRAVAVLLVVASHAGVGAVAGGYVGVDVFFVISGFLITSLLLREVRATGRISLSRFWARRALRLLPASTLVVVTTLAAAWWWLTPLRFTEFARDAAAGAAYVSNIRFALAGTDYLAAAETPSPLQHLWSLAVEEQFYLVWPALLLAVTWRRFSPRLLALVLSALGAGSLLLSVTETQRSAPWAYFGAHTRIWELAVGALLALAAGRLTRLAPRPAAVVGWAGLAAIAVAALTYDDTTAYPGYAALLPVLGAAAVLAAGCPAPAGAAADSTPAGTAADPTPAGAAADPTPAGAAADSTPAGTAADSARAEGAGPAAPDRGVGLMLAVAPMRVIGRLSYGWYLWHWPVLLIGPAALGVTAGLGVNLLLCLGALALAAISLVLVENPVRRHRGLRSKPRRGLAVGAVLTVGTAAAALLLSLSPSAIRVGAAVADVPAALADTADPGRLLTELIAQAASAEVLPANVTPPLAQARADLPEPYAAKCHLGTAAVQAPGPCAWGDLAGARTMVLFGDSHAAQWFPALQDLARSHGWRLLVRTKSSCSAADVLTYSALLKRAYTECATWRRQQLAEFRALTPDMIVVSSSVDTDRPLADPRGTDTEVWRAGWSRTLHELMATGAAVSYVVDTPLRSNVPADCLAANPTRLTACADPVAVTLRSPEVRAASAAEARAAGATVIDPIPWLCSATCPSVLGNLLVYRDAGHLTTGYARMLAPLLLPRLPKPTG